MKKIIIVVSVLFLFSCKQRSKKIEPQKEEFGFAYPKSQLLFDSITEVHKNKYVNAANQIGKEFESDSYKKWCTNYFTDSLKYIDKWMCNLNNVIVKDSVAIFIAQDIRQQFTAKGIILKKDSLYKKMGEIPINSTIKISGICTGLINDDESHYDIFKPVFAIVLDSIKYYKE